MAFDGGCVMDLCGDRYADMCIEYQYDGYDHDDRSACGRNRVGGFAMNDALHAGYVAHLPPPKAAPPVRHLFGDAVTVPADIAPSGYEQKEKTCANCGAVRVTIFGPNALAMRAWRRSPEGPQITTEIPPPCNSDAPWPS